MPATLLALVKQVSFQVRHLLSQASPPKSGTGGGLLRPGDQSVKVEVACEPGRPFKWDLTTCCEPTRGSLSRVRPPRSWQLLILICKNLPTPALPSHRVPLAVAARSRQEEAKSRVEG